MHLDAFWKNWQVREDPFRAEEARNDPVFARLIDSDTTHPEFDKVFGQPDQPATAVVFGEKGSGKTALRLLLEKRIAEHNAAHDDRKAWVVRYDDLNPVLDRFASAVGGPHTDGEVLKKFRLADHQDAMLSRATTRLVDSLLGDAKAEPLGPDARKRVRKMGRDRRINLAVLAALYDQPVTGNLTERWQRIKRTLRVGMFPGAMVAKWLGGLLAVLVLGMVIARRFSETDDMLLTVLTAPVMPLTAPPMPLEGLQKDPAKR